MFNTRRLRLPPVQPSLVFAEPDRRNGPNKPTRNIIFFGQVGMGKSSVINMILGSENAAVVSDGAAGRTFESTAYDASQVFGIPMKLWDTAGLNEGEKGKVPDHEAIFLLYKLLQQLTDDGGVHLLVFVVRGRITSITSRNWLLFHDIICGKKVPGVLIVTGMENVTDPEEWWEGNRKEYSNSGIEPIGHACVTATRGKVIDEAANLRVYDEEYESGQKQVRNLILSCHQNCDAAGIREWTGALEWVGSIIKSVLGGKFWWFFSKTEYKGARKAAEDSLNNLHKKYGVSKDHIKALKAKILQ